MKRTQPSRQYPAKQICKPVLIHSMKGEYDLIRGLRGLMDVALPSKSAVFELCTFSVFSKKPSFQIILKDIMYRSGRCLQMGNNT